MDGVRGGCVSVSSTQTFLMLFKAGNYSGMANKCFNTHFIVCIGLQCALWVAGSAIHRKSRILYVICVHTLMSCNDEKPVPGTQKRRHICACPFTCTLGCIIKMFLASPPVTAGVAGLNRTDILRIIASLWHIMCHRCLRSETFPGCNDSSFESNWRILSCSRLGYLRQFWKCPDLPMGIASTMVKCWINQIGKYLLMHFLYWPVDAGSKKTWKSPNFKSKVKQKNSKISDFAPQWYYKKKTVADSKVLPLI